ncbi:MAG: KilA-N domain-containing protein [Marinilabiliaceae bacterium]|nr:KilA-N domain-containing protein [Marinilabiliaceae bacterium]
MKKISIITVQNIEISIATENNVDYICLTDMAKGQEGEDHIRNWMRNRNTLEFLGAWEMLHNPTFKGVEFDTFLHEAGANRFNMTPRKWIEATDAIGMISKAGRNGGTYAHKDIAFEFGSWLSPVFKLYLITEYQRLKEAENDPMLGELMLANQGNIEAQYEVSLLYRDGTGIVKNEDEALKWLLRAAENGYADADVFVGGIYVEQQNYSEALKYFRRAESNGLNVREVIQCIEKL